MGQMSICFYLWFSPEEEEKLLQSLKLYIRNGDIDYILPLSKLT